MKHLKTIKLFESTVFTDTDIVEFTEDVEVELFADKRQHGKKKLIKKGEDADVFSVPDKGDYIGLQFTGGEIAWVDKKFLKKI